MQNAMLRIAMLAIIAAVMLATPPQAEAQTPWHLQPMDTWAPGECYRSPHSSSGDRMTEAEWKAYGKAEYEANERARKARMEARIQLAGAGIPAPGPNYESAVAEGVRKSEQLRDEGDAQKPTKHWLEGGPLLTPGDVTSAYEGLATALEYVIDEAKAGRPDALRSALRNMGDSEAEIEKAVAHVMGKAGNRINPSAEYRTDAEKDVDYWRQGLKEAKARIKRDAAKTKKDGKKPHGKAAAVSVHAPLIAAIGLANVATRSVLPEAAILFPRLRVLQLIWNTSGCSNGQGGTKAVKPMPLPSGSATPIAPKAGK